MVWGEGLNPVALDWRRFVVLVTPQGEVAACCQVKPHGDGSRELSSLVTRPAWRRQGLGGRLVRHWQAVSEPPLYLTCRASLEPYYQRFGFRSLAAEEMTPYFAKIHRWAERLFRLVGRPNSLRVMVWDSPA